MFAMEKKFAIYRGDMESRSDGQLHHIGARQLAMLYGVPLELCLVVRYDDFRRPDRREFIARAAALIGLSPRYDGDYRLPERPIS